ncbi:MAG TPA: hypothetical protein ENK07_05560, partial [Bacteroidetes bacterium]|nr:hypothetical protein [Bacteroidota bacterium]
MKRSFNSRRGFLALVSLTVLVLASSLYAGNRRLTYAQAFEYAKPRLTKALPAIPGWADDRHYFELRTDSTD